MTEKVVRHIVKDSAHESDCKTGAARPTPHSPSDTQREESWNRSRSF